MVVIGIVDDEPICWWAERVQEMGDCQDDKSSGDVYFGRCALGMWPLNPAETLRRCKDRPIVVLDIQSYRKDLNLAI